MTRNSRSPTDLLLVPSAILVPDELRLDVGSVPTGMTPLGGKPILECIGEAYEDMNLRLIVAVHEGATTIQQYNSRSAFDWNLVDVGETDSLGETIVTALERADIAAIDERRLYLNFADTLVSPIRSIDEGDYIAYQIEDRTYRWTTFDIENGRIGAVSPKYEWQNDNPQPTFVGQFGITEPNRFLHALRDTSDADTPDFYDGLLSYLNHREYQLYEPDSWLDVGHLDTYHRAKKEFLNAREFNELEVNAKNVVTKRSTDVETLKNEIRWYTQIPTKLRPYLPRLYDWSTDPPTQYLEMEYIGYPSLADLQLYGAHGQHIWNSVFYSLFDMIDEFRSFTVDADSEAVEQALQAMYVGKTHRRLDSLADDRGFEQFFGTETVRINGTDYPSLSRIRSRVEDIVSDTELLDRTTFSIIHGDLCLPNVLYDLRNEILKLIDPRGEFGKFTIYGDPRYDLAKLRHSFCGNYEHLINGQFSATNPTNGKITYSIDVTGEQDGREERFDSLLESRYQEQVTQIELIEALLFLSMAPLHADSYERQLCIVGQGIEKIAPYL